MEKDSKAFWDRLGKGWVWGQAAEVVSDPWDQERVHSSCEKWVRHWWGDRNIRFLVDEIRGLGREFDLSNIKCVGGSQAVTLSGQGGYVWRGLAEAGLKHGDIAVNEKDCNTASAVKKALRHELIHAFDDTRAQVNPSDCRHHACSEIRAARLSGECALGEELLRGKSLSGDGGALTLGQQCVQRRANLSVSRNPTCARTSHQSVLAVWDQCLADTAPYQRFPLDIIFN